MLRRCRKEFSGKTLWEKTRHGGVEKISHEREKIWSMYFSGKHSGRGEVMVLWNGFL